MSNHRSIETVFRHNTRLPPGFLRLAPLGTAILKPYLQQSGENSQSMLHRMQSSAIEQSILMCAILMCNNQHKFLTTNCRRTCDNVKRLWQGQRLLQRNSGCRQLCAVSGSLLNGLSYRLPLNASPAYYVD